MNKRRLCGFLYQTYYAVFRINSASKYDRNPCQRISRCLERNCVTTSGKARDFCFMWSSSGD